MPAYGGSLFDPDRFPFLTATTEHGTLAVTVSDRVMLHVLRSVQMAVLKGGEARRISFRDIDVEQIGYIYEGLLGYTASQSTRPTSACREPAARNPRSRCPSWNGSPRPTPTPKKLADAIRAHVEDDQPSAKPQSAAAIAKGIGAAARPERGQRAGASSRRRRRTA